VAHSGFRHAKPSATANTAFPRRDGKRSHQFFQISPIIQGTRAKARANPIAARSVTHGSIARKTHAVMLDRIPANIQAKIPTPARPILSKHVEQ
jgi:hypothetical protein